MTMNTIYFLTGPTGIGKSALAVILARKLNAEIISCDSMQVYRRMNILASVPSRAEQGGIRHHLLTFLEPTRSFNVSAYRRQALKCVRNILKRKKNIVFVGGTGLYISILLDGIFSVKGSDPDYRERLFRKSIKYGSAYVHQKLLAVDPQAAAKIHPNDARRIIRALEVYKVTGKPISQLQENRSGLWGRFPIHIICIDMDRNDLYERINKRVESMFRKGVVREVKKLGARRLSKTASCAIGIREITAYLKGETELETAKDILKRNTRWYAKRQLTWFRKDKRIRWVTITKHQGYPVIAQKILKELLKNGTRFTGNDKD